MKRLLFFSLLAYFLWSPVTTFGQHYHLLTPRTVSVGFFSIFHMVLGALDFMETSDSCCGLRVDFEDKDFYYDKEYGKNWWEYYFEPIDVGEKTDVIKKFFEYKKIAFSFHAEFGISRERGNELIRKYIFLKPHIQKKIDDFCETNFQGSYVIGVHYRGTDKWSEADIVPYKDVYERLQPIVKEQHNYKIFVATDDSYFLTYMHAHFPGYVIAIDAIRSDEGAAVHFTEKNLNYKKGEDAIIDCILLSKCDLLLKMASNLSDCSTSFNPFIPVIKLNKGKYK